MEKIYVFKKKIHATLVVLVSILFSVNVNAQCATGFSESGGMCERVYTSNDTWTIPAGVNEIIVECWGAGGGGGGADTEEWSGVKGGGGGGGAYSKTTLAVTPGLSITINRGAGGSAGSSWGGHGGHGGNSSVVYNSSTVCLAEGGRRGTGAPSWSNGSGGSGGAASNGTGDVKYNGGNGSFGGGGGAGSTQAGSNASSYTGGNGGSSGGGNGGNGVSSWYGAGSSGTTLGGGGGGAADDDWGWGYSGGSGANGAVKVSYNPCDPPAAPSQVVANITVGPTFGGGALLADGNITASSCWDSPDCSGGGHEVWRGRLFNTGTGAQAWASGAAGFSAGEYWQVDLGSVKPVNGVVTQSRGTDCCTEQRVTHYNVEVSANGSDWTTVTGSPFTGNTVENQNAVTNMFADEYEARYIKIVPTAINSHMSMRADVISIRCAGETTAVSAEIPENATTIRWYDAASGGTLMHTGQFFSGVINNDLTLYAEAYNADNGCFSDSRTAVTVYVKDKPSSGTIDNHGETLTTCKESGVSSDNVVAPSSTNDGLTTVWYCGEKTGAGDWDYGNWIRSTNSSSVLFDATNGGNGLSLEDYRPTDEPAFSDATEFLIIRRAYDDCGECVGGCQDQYFLVSIFEHCVEFCADGTYELTSPHITDNILWYDDEDPCAIPIGEGNPFEVALTESTVFYTDGFNDDELTDDGPIIPAAPNDFYGVHGQMFNLEAAASKDIVISAIKINNRGSASQNIKVFYRKEPWGNSTSGSTAGWVEVLNVVTTSGAVATMALDQDIIIPAGCTYGMYTQADVDYRNATTTATKNGLTVHHGIGVQDGFGPFQHGNGPRVFCGELYFQSRDKTDRVTVVASKIPPPTAPDAIAGLTPICPDEEVTLTASGGTTSGDNVEVWFDKACNDAFVEDWATLGYTPVSTTVNSVQRGILNVTSTTIDPMIPMYGIGSWNPNTYKYIQIRYRVLSGTAGNTEIFFTNGLHATANGAQMVSGALISDGSWHILNIDMSTHANWTHSNITGWRYDYATGSGATIDLDFIALSANEIINVGSTYTVSPLETTTYYVQRRGLCGETACFSKEIEMVAPIVTAGTIDLSPSVFCQGGIVGSGVDPTNNSGGTHWWIYSLDDDEWTYGNAGNDLLIDGAQAPGWYYVQRTASEGGACSYDVSVGDWVYIQAKPAAPSITGGDDPLCVDVGATLSTPSSLLLQTNYSGPFYVGATNTPSVPFNWTASLQNQQTDSDLDGGGGIPANLNANDGAQHITIDLQARASTVTWKVARTGAFDGALHVQEYNGSTWEDIAVVPAASIHASGAPVGNDGHTDGSADISADAEQIRFILKNRSGGRIALDHIQVTSAWEWYTGSCEGSFVGAGSSIDISPASTTTYYLKNSNINGCATDCNSKAITINNPAIDPDIAASLSSGDAIWNGLEDTDYNDNENWYVYNGSTYEIAESLPITSTNVVIPKTGTCIENSPNLGSSTRSVKDILIENGATLTIGSGTLNVSRNFTNNGTLTPGTGTVNFNGSVLQELGGSTSTTFYNLTLNNDGGGASQLELNQDISVTNNLTMTDGALDLNNKTIDLGATGTLVGESNSTYLFCDCTDGYIRSSGLVNTADVIHNLGGLGLEITPSTGKGLGDVEVKRKHYKVAAADGLEKSIARVYEVTKNGGGSVDNNGSLEADIAFSYLTHELNGILAEDLSIYRQPTIGVQTWMEYGGAVNVGTQKLSYESWNEFSGLTGGEFVSPLPVTYLGMQAYCDEELGNVLLWQTASEQNAHYFDVERSNDGNEWNTVGRVQAAGNTSSQTDYEYIDEGTNAYFEGYYRLRQVDFDGVYEYFPAVSLFCKSEHTFDAELYPNPTTGIVNLLVYFGYKLDADAMLVLSDATGRIVYQRNVVLQDGTNNFVIDMGNYQQGMYTLAIRVSDEDVLYRKVVKH